MKLRPALLTRISTVPNRSIVALTTASQSAGLGKSAQSKRTSSATALRTLITPLIRSNAARAAGGEAAVDKQCLTSDVSRCRAHQVAHRARHFIGGAEPVQRDSVQYRSPLLGIG